MISFLCPTSILYNHQTDDAFCETVLDFTHKVYNTSLSHTWTSTRQNVPSDIWTLVWENCEMGDIFKITLYLLVLNIGSPNQHILKHLKVSHLKLSALTLAYFPLYFLYVSLSGNHSNHKVTRIDNIFREIECKVDMLLPKQYFLSNG